MILDSPYGEHILSLRSASGEFGSSAVPPPGSGGTWGGQWSSWAAMPVRTEDAAGLPVVNMAINLISDAIGNLPMMVFRRQSEEQIKRATNAWQYSLLHNQPQIKKTPFWFYSGVTRSLLTVGNAFALKMIDPASGRVTDLKLLAQNRLNRDVDRQTGAITYTYRDERGTLYGPWPESRIIHFIGQTSEGTEEWGIGIIARHRQSLGAAIAQEAYRAYFFQNGANPGLVVEWGGMLDTDQVDEWERNWMDRHGGVKNAHRPTILPAGSKMTKVGLTLEDMAFIEMSKFAVSDVSRMFSVPPTLLGQSDVTRPILEDQQVLLAMHGLLPWMVRIEQTLENDPDLFGLNVLYPEFLADALMRPATVERYNGYLAGRQAGWLSINDIRRMENMPPIQGGDQYQLTPVGGAPNLQAGPNGQGGAGKQVKDTVDDDDAGNGQRTLSRYYKRKGSKALAVFAEANQLVPA